MDLESCISALTQAVSDAGSRFPELEFYIFGSCARRDPFPADIDVLIVYPACTDTRDVRRVFTASMGDAPLHLLLASPEEVVQHRLLELQSAVPFQGATQLKNAADEQAHR